MRVLLVDPGSDGLLLAATLRGAGFEVDLGSLADVAHALCDVLVIAGDAPGSLTALRSLRDDGPRPDTKVVLVGVPSGMALEHEGPSFGADWALARADAAEQLVAAVRRVAMAARGRAPVAGLRERTLDLSGERSQVEARVDGTDPPSGEIVVQRHEPDEAESSSAEVAFDAAISPALHALLEAADRRVFPDLSPLPPGLPRGEAHARDLVPESLVTAPAIDHDEEPVLDSLTFVGAVPDARPEAVVRDSMPRTVPGLSARKSVPPPPPEPRLGEAARERTPAARTPAPPRTNPSHRVGSRPGSATPEVVRGDGGLLTWLRALRPFLGGPPFRLELEAQDHRIAMVIAAGVVVDVEAAIEARILRTLERVEAPEEDAARELALRERAGLLPKPRRAALAERARRDLLAHLVAASDVRFSIAPASPRAKSRPFTRRFAPLLCEVVAGAMDAERVFTLLGGEHAVLARSASFADVARECELPLDAELILDARAELPLAEIAQELQAPGTVLVVFGLGGLELRASDEARPLRAQATALRARFDALAARIEEGDYFTVLDLPRTAGATDVAAAHAVLESELSRLGHLAQRDASEALAVAIRSAKVAIDEAKRVLSSSKWREAHRAALRD